MGYIYIHTNKANGKKYIGQTTTEPIVRWGRDGQGYKDNKHFYSAIQRDGWESFTHEVFELSESELDYAERYLIAWYDTTNSEKGYNHESGGNRNKHPSERTRRRMSEAQKGKPKSEEFRQKLKKPKSEEFRQKLSESHKGEKNPFYGQTHSERTKAKISEAKKGHSVSSETRRKQSEAQKGKPNPIKGKPNPHSSETKMKVKALQQLKSQEYKLYKQNGGTLGWNEWNHQRNLHSV